MSKIFLYGLANADQQYRVVRYNYVDTSEETVHIIRELRYRASVLRMYHPVVNEVYAVDDHVKLFRAYQSTVRKNTIAENIAFRDLLQKNGILID